MYILIFWKKNVWNYNILGMKNRKRWSKWFWKVHLIRNLLVYVEKAKSKNKVLEIFMQKWVYTFFRQKTNMIRVCISINRRSFTHKSIYIWNMLVKSFTTIGRIMAKVDYNKSYISLLFGKKSSETAISQERKMKKVRKKVFWNVRVIRNLLVYVEKANSKT